jgi:RNA polymerase sigma factor (sigma-70 family)
VAGMQEHDPLRGDRDAVERFRRGDRRVLERVYSAYVDHIGRLIRWYVWNRGRHRLDAAFGFDDLVQDVFARAFARSAREAYDGARSYGPYLFTIARNVVTNALRTGGPFDYRSQAPFAPVAVEASPLDGDSPWADPSVLGTVRAYLAGVSPEIAAVHHHRYVRGLSQAAAATALGFSRQRLRTLEKKLRSGLRRELQRAARTKHR